MTLIFTAKYFINAAADITKSAYMGNGYAAFLNQLNSQNVNLFNLQERSINNTERYLLRNASMNKCNEYMRISRHCKNLKHVCNKVTKICVRKLSLHLMMKQHIYYINFSGTFQKPNYCPFKIDGHCPLSISKQTHANTSVYINFTVNLGNDRK